MNTVTDLPHAVTDTPLVWIPLSDGTRLAARLWLPDGTTDGPVPAILEYLPYRRRDGTAVRDQLTHPYLAGHGYACLRVDMRGNGDSDGLMEDEYSAQELADAVEVIGWIAHQPWCSGAVGMMGISWGGFNSLQVAALAPPALKAVITLCSTVDRYADDIHYKGGCMLGENLGWAGTMWSFSSRPPDPAMRPDDWRELWLSRLENEPFLALNWFRHQRRDDYWRHGSVCEDYGAIRAAVMAVGGWGDSYKNAVPQLVENIQAPVRGIVGPWIHKYPHFASPEPRIGFLQEALRWWDRHLKGVETGVDHDPAYVVYMLDGDRPATWYSHRPGHWVAEPAWPRPDAARESFALGQSAQGHGTLQVGDEASAFEATIASPEHCGMDSGEFCAIFLGPEMPGDQRHDDALSACFDSAPLEQTDILGAPTLRLRLKSDQPVAHVAVRLNHVHPDGASTRITWGVLNLCHRNGHEEPQPLVPGEEIEVAVPLDHIAYRLPEGHRLRVAVSSAYFPMIWPSPQPVALMLTGGALDLPMRPSGDSDEIAFPAPEAAAPLKLDSIRPEAHTRRSEIDQQSGRISLIIEDDFGESRDSTHGLISGSILRERWEIHPGDPLSARAMTDWTQVIERDGLRLRTEARTWLHADAMSFHLSGRLEAWENDRLVHARDVSETVPRDHL